MREYIKVPSIAGNLTDEEIQKVKVDRDEELYRIIHLLIIASENVLVIGDRGQGKTFLSRLVHNKIEQENSNILPVRIDLTGLHFYQEPFFHTMWLPILILNQLCKEIWINLFKKEYSKLLNIHDNLEEIKLFKKKSEKKVIEVYNILKKEELKVRNEMHASIGASIGIKGDTGSKESHEWKNRKLQNFEILELIKELKEAINKDFSKNRIVLICDEANKLTEESQQIILNSYIDFLGSNQFNFLLVASNHEDVKYFAMKSSLFRVIELNGFKKIAYIKDLIEKSFDISKIKIDENIYELIFEKFEVFIRSLYIMNETNKSDVNTDMVKIASDQVFKEIEDWKSRITAHNTK